MRPEPCPNPPAAASRAPRAGRTLAAAAPRRPRAYRRRQPGRDPPRRRPLRAAHHAAGQADPDQMSAQPRHPGAAAVGRLAELPPLERQVIRCLRLWCDGAGRRGPAAPRACRPPRRRRRPRTCLADFDELIAADGRHSRRPLLGHAPRLPLRRRRRMRLRPLRGARRRRRARGRGADGGAHGARRPRALPRRPGRDRSASA